MSTSLQARIQPLECKVEPGRVSFLEGFVLNKEQVSPKLTL